MSSILRIEAALLGNSVSVNVVKAVAQEVLQNVLYSAKQKVNV